MNDEARGLYPKLTASMEKAFAGGRHRFDGVWIRPLPDGAGLYVLGRIGDQYGMRSLSWDAEMEVRDISLFTESLLPRLVESFYFSLRRQARESEDLMDRLESVLGPPKEDRSRAGPSGRYQGEGRSDAGSGPSA